MRFHHSTRRRANRFGHREGGAAAGGSSSSSASGRGHQASRWAQLSYCRMTNIHFNSRHQVEPPTEMQRKQEDAVGEKENRSLKWSSTGRVASDNGGELGYGLGEAAVLIAAGENLNGHKCDGNSGEKDDSSGGQLDETARLESELEHMNLGAGCAMRLIGEQQLSGPSAAESQAGGVPTPLDHPNEPEPEQQQEARAKCDAPKEQPAAAAKASAGCGGAPAAPTKRSNKKLDIESAREKLIAQVEKHPFWSNKAAKRMRLLDVCERQIYIYELVSYCERRDLEWRYEPFRGGLSVGAGKSGNAACLATGTAPSGARLASASSSQLLTRQQSVGGRLPSELELESVGSGGSAAGERLLAAPAGGATRSPPLSQPTSPLAFDLELDEALRRRRRQPQAQAANGQQQFTFAAPHKGTEAGRRHSLIRRSCSSATSSPVHQLASSGRLETGSSRHLASEVALADTQLGATASCPIERPLPSAHFVWSIEPPEKLRPAPFAASVHSAELPQSSFVKRCHGCSGRGRLKCSSCYGVGYEVCIGCSGKGTLRCLGSATGSRFGGAAGGYHSSGHGTPTGDSRAGNSGWGGEPAESSFHCVSSGSRAGRHEEPGGITQSGGGGGWQTEACHYCHGAGQKRCWICAGRSYQTCTACAGTGQLRCYLNLNITWLKHRDECVLNNSDSLLPRERLKLSTGLVLLDQEGARLSPLESSFSLYAADLSAAAASSQAHHQRTHKHPATEGANVPSTTADAPARVPPAHGQQQQQETNHQKQHKSAMSQMIKPTELNQLHSISCKLLEKHQQSYTKQERLLQQRHKVTQIECFVVNWEWKRRRGHFVIYGDERKVYIAKYPFKSICSIT